MSYGDGYAVRSLGCTYPDGWRLDRHHHRWDQLAFAVSGVMRVEADCDAWLVPPTRAVWLPARFAHSIVMRGEVATRFLYLAPELVDRRLPSSVQVLEAAPLLRELIVHVLGIGMLDASRAEHARLAGLLIDLIAKARPIDLHLPLPTDRRALTLAMRIGREPADRALLSDLARQSGASLRTLQRLFPRQTGLTPEAWRLKARLIGSVAALSAGASVAAAAADSGYNSPSAFVAAFKRHFGVTPAHYRREATGRS